MNDGRHIDGAIGALGGEASQQRVKRPDEAHPLKEADRSLPIERPSFDETTETYYEMPVVKAPPWVWYIPAYFYVGGVAGASAALGAALQLRGEERELVERSRWLSLVSISLGAVFLTADLGVPSRFYNMMRVFRPSSPLNVGTWLIAASNVTSGAAAVSTLMRRPALRRVGDGFGLAAGIVGLPLASYTAVVLTSTAIPAWSRVQRTLPFLFAASAATSAASLLELAPQPAVVRRLGIAGKVAELVAMEAVEEELGDDRVGEPYRRSWLWGAAKVLTAASLGASLLGGRRLRVASALLGTAGAIAMRVAVLDAGKASAADPRATFEPQRNR